MKRACIAIALAVILAASAGYFSIWTGPDELPRQSNPMHGARHGQCRSGDPFVERRYATHPATSASTDDPEATALRDDRTPGAGRFGSTYDESIPDPQDLVQTEVCCVSPSGEPVGGLQLDLHLSFKAARLSEASYSRQCSVHCDSRGKVVLSERKGCRLSIVVQEPLWRSELTRTVFGNSRSIEITAFPAAEARVRAMYDDGTPVTGRGDVRCLGKLTCTCQFMLDDGGNATVAAVPLHMPLTCRVYSHTRPGYDSFEVPIGPGDVADQKEILVVVPKSRVTGGIKVVFADTLPAVGSDVWLEQENGWPQYLDMAHSQESVQWGGLRGGSRYRVAIQGELAWLSDWIPVAAGEVTTVSARLTRCGAIRARIVDDSGLPVTGAVLRISDGAYLPYKSTGLARSRPGMALAGADGAVELRRVPAGRLVAEVEAWSREVAKREVTIEPGAVVDLGDIVLAAAYGSIEVELIGPVDGIDYHVTLLQPAGPPILEPVSAKGGRCTFSGLPIRKYVIAVTPGKYGSVASQRVEITDAETNVLARIDVHGLQQALSTGKRR